MTTENSPLRADDSIGQSGRDHDHAACIRDLFAPLRRFSRAGGPRPREYSDLDRYVWRLAAHLKVAHVTRDEIDAQLRSLGTTFLWGTLIGFGFLRPHGYSGDFEIIDRIHQKFVSSDPRCCRWDVYFHQLMAPQAVRNRKELFKSLVQKLSQRVKPVSILNLGSGPCRDVAEFLDTNPHSGVHFTCVDHDIDAIRYAKKVCAKYTDNVEFVRANVIRDRLQGQYDLVWSAGVADYLSDRLFIALLERALTAVAPGGELIVGNFSDRNPSRDHMEVLGRWYLRHRSRDELTSLGVTACGSTRHLSVDSEPTGVNLFLRIKAPS